MHEWIKWHGWDVMTCASFLGNCLSMPVFVAAAAVACRRLRTTPSVLLLIATVVAFVSKLLRWLPAAQCTYTRGMADGQVLTDTGPSALGITLEILYRVNIFVVAALTLWTVLAWRAIGKQAHNNRFQDIAAGAANPEA